jgi:hypothetical protein
MRLSVPRFTSNVIPDINFAVAEIKYFPSEFLARAHHRIVKTQEL